MGDLLKGLVNAHAGVIELPAVIVAAQAALLHPAVRHVRAAVRAVAVDQSVVSAFVLVEDQVFAQKTHGLDRLILHLAHRRERSPVAP